MCKRLAEWNDGFVLSLSIIGNCAGDPFFADAGAAAAIEWLGRLYARVSVSE
ncbi:hypothetical protein BSIN_0250 [Burkholderia singularis]|uniref:Uncharacterized protein n=1 Tax=Burkholderia singularis TaxID=1503053 RepID=A0A238H4N1_9BURK|nr:hypothetical protein BSIN_0250 [Burkholderia singularis]